MADARDVDILPPDPTWQPPRPGPEVVYDVDPAAGQVRREQVMPLPADAGGRFASGVRWGTRLLVLGALGLVALWLFEPFGPRPLSLAVQWLRDHGAVGRPLVVVVIAIGVPFLMPVGPVAIVPAYVWGAGEGLALALTGAVLGGLVNFALARRFAVLHIEGWLRRRPLLASLRETLRRRGFRLALGLRLSPIMNFGMLCYLCGLAGIGAGRFALAMALGGVPWTAVYAVGGAVLAESAREVSLDAAAEGPEIGVLRWAGLFVTVTVAVWIGRIARTDWKRQQAAAKPQ
ncbi:MAG: DedA family protein [Myxococcales bacterium]|nr:DedA family protein [Myxococcales bacterium]